MNMQEKEEAIFSKYAHWNRTLLQKIPEALFPQCSQCGGGCSGCGGCSGSCSSDGPAFNHGTTLEEN